MKITHVKLFKTNRADVLGYAEITIDDCFRVKEIMIFREPEGYRIAMPRVKLNTGRFNEIASPLDAKTHKMIENAVISEYERVSGKPRP
jgi:DNA-binding cell septation regulator SpoVG